VRPADDTILWLVKRAFSTQRRYVERAMAANGVSAPQAGVLVQLVHQPGLSSSEVARILGISPQAATVAVVDLEHEGLLERITDPAHRRIRRCYLTPAGQHIAEQCLPAALEVQEKLLALFDDQQREQFATLLRMFVGELPPDDGAGSGAIART
jgi:DNA-binding MarR family transcriptional regulator